MRRELRARRRRLSASARIDAALAVAGSLLVDPILWRVRHLAGFVAADAELDPGPFLAAARGRGCAVYLPVLAPTGHGRRLSFVRTEAGQALAANRYGIPEPQAGLRRPAPFLDLALVPLVGFDDRGNRLGMGAGYYDRTFAYLPGRRLWRRPRLIGVAYECQRVDEIRPRAWDVPLDGVVTERGLQWFTEYA